MLKERLDGRVKEYLEEKERERKRKRKKKKWKD